MPTIDQAKSMTLAQLQTALTPTKRDALITINGSPYTFSTPTSVYNKDGQIESQAYTERDVETGIILASHINSWTYYSTGEVNEILVSTFDAVKNETRDTTIKHYRDGRQPTASVRTSARMSAIHTTVAPAPTAHRWPALTKLALGLILILLALLLAWYLITGGLPWPTL